jgi:cytochrome c oxidase subunit 2
MTRTHRPRRLASLVPACATVFALSACSGPKYPNTIFTSHTDFNVDVGHLFGRLFLLATIVFILVEALLLYAIFRYRAKPGHDNPKHVHGNTTLEVLWTAIPAVILIFIAVPTVRTIFRTQAKARPDALQVEVIGHQWWWEFRYPEYKITTANELYIPAGRTVNFAMTSVDVIHSFWIPALAGKRDVVPNHTNYVWFTPGASTIDSVWNGHCAEYCGGSHANMKFRTYTVTPEQFASWVKGQQQLAAFGATPAPGAAPAATPTPAAAPGATPAAGAPQVPRTVATAAVDTAPTVATVQTAAYVFPVDKMPAHTVPSTPLPAGLTFNASLKGDAERGMKTFNSTSCIGCHAIAGNPMAMGPIGPNLTHIGSRHTLAAGLYPNDTKHLSLWIKNARAMKPSIVMPTLGLNETDPMTKGKVTAGGLTDQQIADIVAYLQALK